MLYELQQMLLVILLFETYCLQHIFLQMVSEEL